MGKVSINVEKITKKLETVTISQDSIQSLSSYLLVFKKYSDKVVETWLGVLRKSSENRRLILFYVANEILQTCRHKNALNFKISWKKYIPKAIEMMKDTGVAPKIERILSIWEDRRVYDTAYINELKKMLLRQEYITPVTKTRITDPKKVVEEYSPEAGIEALRKCSILEEDSKFKLKQLDQSKLDFSNLDAVRKLKDRAHGREFSQMFEESYTALEEYVKSLEVELEQRKKMMETLERAEVFYDNQYHDAAVVADAYFKYGNRVAGMRQKVSEYLDNMPDDDVPSVDVEDAPSPGNTPPHMRVDVHDSLETFDRHSSGEEDMDLSDEELRTVEPSRNRLQRGSHHGSDKGGDRYGIHEDDRYSPSGALPAVDAPLEPSADNAAAAAAMRIVSGYRPPVNVQAPLMSQKAQATRDPRIHGLQLGIPPPPPPPLAPHLHPGGPPLLPPSLLNAAVALQSQPPPPPPRAGTPVRDEPPDSGNQGVSESGPSADGAGGSTPTQDEPPESSLPTEPPTPNTAINFLSNFIQLNTNPTAVTSVVQPQPLSPAVQSIPGLWNSPANPNPPPPMPPPQPPQAQSSVAAAVRLLSPQLMSQAGGAQPPPPPVPDSVSDSWPRPFHLPPPPPPPPSAVRMVAAAAHAAVQFAAVGQGRLPQTSAALEFGQRPALDFGAKSPMHVSPPVRQQASALRHLPLSSDGPEGDRKAGSSSQDSDEPGNLGDAFDKFPNRAPSPSENKLPGLGNFSDDLPTGSKDVETGENEGHDVLMDHDEDDRDLSQQERFGDDSNSMPRQMHDNDDMCQPRGFQALTEQRPHFDNSQQLHRIQTIGGNVPQMRHMHPQRPHGGMQSQPFHHAGPGGRFMGGVGPRPPRFGSGGPRGNFAPRQFWQHPGGGPRGFRGQHRPIGPRF